MKPDTKKQSNSLKRSVKAPILPGSSSEGDDDLFETAMSGSSSSRDFANMLNNTNTAGGAPANHHHNANIQTEEEDFLSENPGWILLIVLLSFLLLLYLVYLQFPAVSSQERKHIKVPMNIEEAKILAVILDRYKDEHYWVVLSGFCLVYIFLQTFSIPGSIFLSIMSGFLFPFLTAVSVTCFCAATGASGCYMLSWLFGRKCIQRHFPEEIRKWTEKVNEERENLIHFMIFLRVTPILPNWFINIASPLIGVPLGIFWLGTFIGVAPPTMLAVQGGKTLNVMTSSSDYISWSSMLALGAVAIIALIPVLWRRYTRS